MHSCMHAFLHVQTCYIASAYGYAVANFFHFFYEVDMSGKHAIPGFENCSG